MNPLAWLTSGLVEGVGKATTGVVKTIWGDRSEKDTALAAEQMAVVAQYATEFAVRPQRTFWDSFIDGMNRIIRPSLAISVQAAFVWAVIDPVSFAESMQALQIVPEQLWYLWGGIISFYFGGRILETMPKTWVLQPRALTIAKEIVAERAARAQVVVVAPPAAPQPDVVINVAPQPEEATATTPPPEAWATVPVGGAPVVPAPAPAATGDNAASGERAMAATLWGEARGEPREGKVAVAWVIRNRAAQPGWWGTSIAGVCTAKAQFTCWWDAQSERVRTVDESDARFADCLDIARSVIGGEVIDPTRGADHYYADSMPSPPKWALGRTPIAVIGHHRFFRIGLRG
jgi:cell wall hydrolase